MNWMVLYGNKQVVEEDVRDVGKMLGVYCENSFQMSSRGSGGGRKMKVGKTQEGGVELCFQKLFFHTRTTTVLKIRV